MRIAAAAGTRRCSTAARSPMSKYRRRDSGIGIAAQGFAAHRFDVANARRRHELPAPQPGACLTSDFSGVRSFGSIRSRWGTVSDVRTPSGANPLIRFLRSPLGAGTSVAEATSRYRQLQTEGSVTGSDASEA